MPGAVEWPTPQRLPIGPLVNYGYEGTVLLAAPLVVPADFRAASFDVQLRAEWLVCREQCIPQSGDLSLSVPSQAATGAAVMPICLRKPGLRCHVNWRRPRPLHASRRRYRLVDGLPEDLKGKPVTFFAGDAGVIDHAAALEQRWKDGKLSLRVPLSPQRNESPPTMQAVIAGPGSEPGVAIRFAVADWPATMGTSTARPAAVLERPAVARDPASILPTLVLASPAACC